jgi:hypothetical protein
MDAYDHLVHVDAGKKEVVIYRVGPTGEKSHPVSLPLHSGGEDVDAVALMLGENLLWDSPTARTLLKL